MAALNPPDLLRAARNLLAEVTTATRNRGQSYYRSGAVSGLTQRSGGCFTAKVGGSDALPYDVTISFTPAAGRKQLLECDADCSCPMGWRCKHISAVLYAIIDQSTSPTTASPIPQPAKATLTSRLKVALGRALTSDERNYVQRIEQSYQHARYHGSIGGWHMIALGFDEVRGEWRLEIEKESLKTVFDFWNNLASFAVHEWGLPFPEFMAGVTNVTVDEDRIKRRQQEKTIKQWSTILAKIEEEADLDPGGSIELRVRCFPNRAVVEIRKDVEGEFQELSYHLGQALSNRVRNDSAVLTGSALILWAIISADSYFGYKAAFAYDDASASQHLRRIIASASLRDCIVTQSGTPYKFSEDPLRLRLEEPTGADKDYTVSLVQSDGSPLPPRLAVLNGSPLIVVSADVIYFGPKVPNALKISSGAMKIPAVALESATGLRLLQILDLKTPESLAKRVQVVPFRISVQGELAPIYPGSPTEHCRVRLLATSADGAVAMSWNGSNWTEEDEATTPSSNNSDSDAIIFYDRSGLAAATELVSGLNLRWDRCPGMGVSRLTKSFPEEFAAFSKSLPPDVSLELKGDLAPLAGDAVVGNVKLEVTEAVEGEIDWFDLRVILDVSELDLSPEELRLLMNAQGGYVRLKGKGWRRLQFNLTDEEDEQLARLGLNPRELTAEPQRLHVLQLADPAARKFLQEEQVERVHRRASELKARVTPDVPIKVAADLRPYQRDGFHFLSYLSANRFGGILADDMGLGKTLQTLTWLTWLRSEEANAERPTLVVCPKSVMDNWRNEITRFTRGVSPRVWSAGELEQLPQEAASADLHIINYSQLRILGESLAPVRWLAVILDEGQYIKNPGSQTAQVARSLHAEHRLVLTGTPIENRLLDLWSLMNFAMPGVLGSRTQFNRQFGSKDDPHARRRLSARVRPFLIRRTKSQVAKDLPDKVEEDLYCELEGEQRALYRAELKHAQQMLLRVQTSKQLAKDRFHFLTSLLRLRQICCHPRLVSPESRAVGAKVEALIEQLEPLMEEGQKVLVFSQFVSMLDLLKDSLSDKDWPLYYLAGDTENRGALVEQFQNAEGNAIFLISLKAGGFGLNLTSAGYVILFDPWWNPAVENQAIDRTHRIGQKQKVIAYRLLMKDTVEEKIRALQKQKRHLAEDVLGEEKFAKSLTLDDLRFLLS